MDFRDLHGESCQLPVASCQLPVIGYRISVIGYRLSVPSARIELRLDAKRVRIDGPDKRLVIFRHDDDAAIGDGVASAILVDVVADLRAARNEYVAIHDHAPQLCVPSDAHARHQDAFLDAAEAMDADVGAEHAAAD